MLDFRIGLLLGMRQLRRASPWTTILIIIVVIFTFINLVAVGGVLSGIVDGAIQTTRDEAYGDVAFVPLKGENRVLNTQDILRGLTQYDSVVSYSARYNGLATIEANFAARRDLNQKPDTITATIVGIDPVQEADVTKIRSLISEGSYFEPNESGYILLGQYTIDRFADKFGDAFEYLDGVVVGDKVRVTVGTNSEEYIVKGIVASKVDVISLRAFLPEREFRRLFGRQDYNADEIVIRINAQTEAAEAALKEALTNDGFAAYGKINTFTRDLPKFLLDVVRTFDLLSVVIGAIGIIVASITVFIVILISALSRKRQIGILKAIGISERAIEYAYLTQAGFYAVVGSAIGMSITLLFLAPYFSAHPIDFPYGDVSLSIRAEGMALRSGALLLVMLVAGFIPAWLIARQNTLDSILGRR